MENTVTQTVEYVPFRERIAMLNVKELRSIASEEFGLNIDEKLKKEIIIDQLIRIHEEKTASAKNLNEKSAALFISADKDERLVSVKFLNLEFPTASEEFCNDGGLGIRGTKNPKPRLKPPYRLSKMPRFKLIPGEVYKLPIRIIRVLESLTYRDSKPIYDPVTGMITGNIPIIKPRFMLQVVLSDKQMQEMGTAL